MKTTLFLLFSLVSISFVAAQNTNLMREISDRNLKESADQQYFVRPFSIPANWKKVDADGLFSFYLPPEARDTGSAGTEDYYKDYRIGNLAFRFVYQPTSILAYDSREQEFGENFQESNLEIRDLKAYLFSYHKLIKSRQIYYTEIHVGDLPNGHVKLWMQADSANPNDLKIARQIFGTVQFSKPQN